MEEQQSTSNNKRIAKNTIYLYFRMLITMVVGLYTSRVILNTLGVEDYGINNVVGGVIAMFSLISASISGSIGRFLTFELGRGNMDALKKVFSTSVTIQIILSIIIVVIAEIIGIWFLNNKLQIPADRMYAAHWVFHCSIISFVIGLISLPYKASIISHEKIYAYNNPIILIMAVSLFMIFHSIKLNSKTINNIAKSTFAIYLLHTNPNIMQEYFVTPIQHFFENYSGILCFVQITLIIIYFSITAIIYDIPRRLIWNNFIEPYINKYNK